MHTLPTLPAHGSPRRGTLANPAGRFETLAVARETWLDPDDPALRTRLLVDRSRSVIARNQSPDVGFEVCLNPYRGCEHGCAYCYARPGHEYLGLSAGLDFETKILVKPRAPELLRRELAAPGWRPRTLLMSGVTDPYQPAERRLRLTRRCLEVLSGCRQPVAVITKSHLVTRDADLLAELAEHGAAHVTLSITTLRPELHAAMEPRAAAPSRRLAAIEALARAGVPVGVNVAPIVPGLTDEEVPRILAAAAAAGATHAAFTWLRLPGAVAPLFIDWLERRFPERRERVLGLVRGMRGGRLNDPRFGSRMRGKGAYARQLSQWFAVECGRLGLSRGPPELSAAAFRPPRSGKSRPGGALPPDRALPLDGPAAGAGHGGARPDQIDLFAAGVSAR